MIGKQSATVKLSFAKSLLGFPFTLSFCGLLYYLVHDWLKPSTMFCQICRFFARGKVSKNHFGKLWCIATATKNILFRNFKVPYRDPQIELLTYHDQHISSFRKYYIFDAVFSSKFIYSKQNSWLYSNRNNRLMPCEFPKVFR